jgi:hypothetical protein
VESNPTPVAEHRFGRYREGWRRWGREGAWCGGGESRPWESSDDFLGNRYMR